MLAKKTPPLKSLYMDTPTLSVEADQEMLSAVWETAVTERLVGTEGGVRSPPEEPENSKAPISAIPP